MSEDEVKLSTSWSKKPDELIRLEKLEEQVAKLGEQHVFFHYDKDVKPTFNVKIEKNSKGFNWEITLIGCNNQDEAFVLGTKAQDAINALIFNEMRRVDLVQ